MDEERTVFVVDDDVELRESIEALVSSLGCRCQGFPSAESFLADHSTSQRGVLVVDFRMPGMNGLEFQEELNRRECHMPLVLLTAYARTELVVQALQAGAITAIDKPYHDDDLWKAIHHALEKEEKEWADRERQREIRERLENLTDEELRVSELIVAGLPNKLIAQRTGLAIRTVEKRRHNVFTKLQIDSVAQLVALFLESRS